MNRGDLKQYLGEIIDREIERLPEEPTAEDYERLRILGKMKKMAVTDPELFRKLNETS